MPTTLTLQEIAKLRAETLCAERTIRNWARDPSSVLGATRARLEAAAERLDVKRPSSPPPQAA